MLAQEKIFREYDIRGVVGVDFDAGLAEELGKALAAEIRKNFSGKGAPRVAVGYDCRVSAPEMKAAMHKGLLAGGVSVIDTGMGPTPQLYYAVVKGKLDGGVQITASHNPGDQNGFKMMIGQRTLSGPDIQALKQAVFANLGQTPPVPEYQAELTVDNIRPRYIAELIALAKPQIGTRKLKVIVDGGNGVGGLVGPDVLRGLGCEVIEMFTEPDGRFPNHHPDPTVLENIVELRKRVVEEQADVGIAWDGDADRIGVVDEKGNAVFGDMLLIIYGRRLLSEVELPTIIGDVKCSELLFSDLEERGAKTVMSRTGHSLIKAKLKELHAELAGEMSGHMFFAHRYFGYDDALHASARLVEILSNTDEPISQMLADLPKMVATPELRVDVPESIKFKIAEQAKTAFPEYKVSTIDGVRIKFAKGWGLVRASNTQACLVMRFEAETESDLEQYKSLVEERIDKLQSELS